jgi:cation:H+ antiporter
LVWLQFIALAIVIVIAGTKAARYGDVIAERTGLGRVRVGLMLLAVISSMPELVTGVSSVTLVDTPGLGQGYGPDFGVGTLLGSTLFNLTILVVLDVLSRGGPVLSKASRSHLPLAGMGILLMAGAGFSIRFAGAFDGAALGWVGVPTLVIMVVYLAGIWFIMRRGGAETGMDRATVAAAGEPASVDGGPIWRVWAKLAVSAVAIIAAGIFLPYVANDIAAVTGWGASFVGSLLLAIATSLPELVIAIAAFRLGAIDLAVADILGANMLDVAHLFTIDLFFTAGPVLSSASGAHATTAAIVTVMTAIVAAGILLRRRRKTFRVVSWYAVLILGLYLYGAYALFSAGLGTG